MRTRSIGVAIVLLVVLLAGAVVYAREKSWRAPQENGSSIQAKTAYWESRIQAVGASEAYQEFGHSVVGENASDQHGDAHTFGAALYEAVGLSGITTCDAQFSSGCFHEFIGRAIADQGLDVVDKLNDYCSNKGGCQHGIGHGLVAYLGYSGNDLEKALGICSGLPGAQTQTLQGCLGGIFMEYNMRTMVASDNTAARAATSTDDLLAPCDQFSGIEERSCLLYQPQWWWTSFVERGESGVFSKMAQLCDETSGDSREVCYVGIGEMAPPAGAYDPMKTAVQCEGATHDDSMRTFCDIGAALVFEGTGGADKATDVCATLGNDAAQKMCDTYSKNSTLIDTL